MPFLHLLCYLCVLAFVQQAAYLLLLCVQRGGQRRAHGKARRWGGRLPEIVLRRVRAGHGIARLLGVARGREYHHHSGQRQRPSLLNEPPHPGGGGGQRAERQRLAVSAAAVGTVRTARAILLHARDGPTLGANLGMIARATARDTNNNSAGADGSGESNSQNAPRFLTESGSMSRSLFNGRAFKTTGTRKRLSKVFG